MEDFNEEIPTPVMRADDPKIPQTVIDQLSSPDDEEALDEPHGYVIPTTMRIINKSGYPLEYHSEGAIGLDLHAVTGRDSILIEPGRRWLIDTGITIELPDGFGAFVQPRSGIARDHGVVAVTGTIDRDYRGSIKVNVINHGHDPYKVLAGDRIAQLVLVRTERVHIVEVEELSITDRGDHGFGSSGR